MSRLFHYIQYFSKKSQSLHNRLFLLRCTLWLFCILRFRQIKILTNIQSTFLLNLCDIKIGNLKPCLFQLYFSLIIGSHHSDCLPANEIFGFGHYPCLSTAITKRNSHRSGSYRWIAKSTISEQTLPINRQIDHICRFDSTLYYMKSQRKIYIAFSYFLFYLAMI